MPAWLHFGTRVDRVIALRSPENMIKFYGIVVGRSLIGIFVEQNHPLARR